MIDYKQIGTNYKNKIMNDVKSSYIIYNFIIRFTKPIALHNSEAVKANGI